jgi:hypothetical protein
MQQTIKGVPRAPRAKLAQPVRLRPYDSHCPEEICVTRNVSRKGFYFETLLGHYFSGMSLSVTRNFRSGDPMTREEVGDVVRVEKLGTSKWGVANPHPGLVDSASWVYHDRTGRQNGNPELVEVGNWRSRHAVDA